VGDDGRIAGFWFIRIIQIIAYWPLVSLLGFPNTRQSEWDQREPQKFERPPFGHDLIWCPVLPTDDRRVFPGRGELRKSNRSGARSVSTMGKKCANCKTDFPTSKTAG